MTSKERLRRVYEHKAVEKVPTYFEATDYVFDALLRRYNMVNRDDLYDYFNVDVREIEPAYIGSTAGISENTQVGQNYRETGIFGEITEYRWNGLEYNTLVVHHPLDEAEQPEEIEKLIDWPHSSCFNYESIKYQLDKYRDKGIIFGHWGPFQTASDLRNEGKLYMDMALNPDLCHAIFKRMHQFQMDHYEQILKAGEGRIDILRTHDDYGTQRNLLFSVDMWKEYFQKHTQELVDLAHSYGAFFQQHSCGAVSPIIPELIACGVDGLEPIQPVEGMDPATLHDRFGQDLCFIGGIDTQYLLVHAKPKEVVQEVRRYIETFTEKTGYILYPSQAWESCIPPENIEAFYFADRNFNR